MAEFGQDYFRSNYRDYAAQNSPRKLGHYLSSIEARSAGQVSMLDVGCGHGLWAAYAAHRQPNWTVTAMDVDPQIVAANSDRFEQVRFITGRAGEANLGTTFDIVTAMDVLEHVPGLDDRFESVCGWVKPGGLFVFVVPVYDGPLGPIVHLLDKDPTHIHKWSRERWLELARRHLLSVQWHGLFRLLLPTDHYVHFSSRPLRRISPAIFVSGRVAGPEWRPKNP